MASTGVRLRTPLSAVLPRLAAFVLIVVFLWPTLALPYLGDDMFNAYLDGWIGYERLSTSQAFGQYFAIETQSARFYPIFAALIFAMFHFLNNLVLLKILVLTAMLANAATFYWLLRLTVPRVALLAVVLLPLTWQIRFFHDPIIQFSLHMQLTLEFLLLGFVGLAAFLKSGRSRYLALGGLSYLLACMTYEPTYSYALVYVASAVVFGDTTRKRALGAVAFAFPAFACGAVTYALRVRFPLSATDQHAFSWTAAAVFRTFWNQALGALPLSYLVTHPAGVLAPPTLPWQPADGVVAILAFLAIAAAFSGLRSAQEDVKADLKGRTLPSAAALAGLAWLLPGVAVALSPRWQSQVMPGLPYIPVYLAEPAVALMLAFVLLGLVGGRGASFGIARYAIALVGALGILTTYRMNTFVIGRFTAWNMTVPDALDAGVLRDARSGAVVYLDSSYPAHAQRENDPGDAKYYLYKHTATRLVPRRLTELPSTVAHDSFLLVGSTEGFDSGVVVAGRIVGIQHTDAGVEPMLADFERYVRRPGEPATITQWNSTCGPIRADRALEGRPSVIPPVQFRGPFSYEENDESGKWRWLGGPGAVGISNGSDRPIDALVSFSMRAIADGRTVSVMGPGFQVVKTYRGSDVAVRHSIAIGSHATAWISLSADGPPLGRPPDPRLLLLQLRDLTVTEPACGDHRSAFVAFRSRRAVTLLPRSFVPRKAAMTRSALSLATSTSENLSPISIAPMSRISRWASLAMAPTRSPGRTPALRPRSMNSRVMFCSTGRLVIAGRAAFGRAASRTGACRKGAPWGISCSSDSLPPRASSASLIAAAATSSGSYSSASDSAIPRY